MKMIDLIDIDIVEVAAKDIEFVGIIIEDNISQLPMTRYMLVLENAIAATTYNTKTVCFKVVFESKLSNKDLTHFSKLITDLIFYSFTGFDKRDRESRLGCPIAGNVSEMALKRAINNITGVDKVNVVCECGGKNRRIV